MKAFRCDRCGEYYTSNKGIKIKVPFEKNSLDLCPKCKEELKKFLNIEDEQKFLEYEDLKDGMRVWHTGLKEWVECKLGYNKNYDACIRYEETEYEETYIVFEENTLLLDKPEE